MARTMNVAVRFSALALVLLAMVVPGRPAAAADDVVRLTFNPGIYDSLPLMVALDKGYFAAQHLDVQVTKTPQSVAALIPLLARGDIDVAPVIMAPSFFNQSANGFGVKVLASMDQSHHGWNDTVWMMVRQDVWDAKTIRMPADLKGKAIPKPVGAPVDFLTIQILSKGGLTMNDVNASRALSGPTDLYPAFRNKVFEVESVQEPLTTQFEKQGLGHRWLSYQDVAPYYQSAYIGTSADFAKSHRAVLQRFMNAYLKACAYIDRSGGKWTPDLIDSIVKWSGLPRDTIAAIPGPAYPGLGEISTYSMSQQQTLWVSLGMLKTPVPLTDLIDASFLTEARKQLNAK
jgi:ABC-type nitrate/sulfonate/bicarbonate transport system substrate-binding protein